MLKVRALIGVGGKRRGANADFNPGVVVGDEADTDASRRHCDLSEKKMHRRVRGYLK